MKSFPNPILPKLDPDALSAIMRLLHNEDFQLFLEALADRAEVLNRVMVQGAATGADLAIQKGQTREITYILEAIQDSPSRLREVQQPKK